MSDASILTFFPKTVYYKTEFYADKLDYLYNELYSAKLPYFKDTSLSVNSSHKTFDKLYTLDQFKEFSNDVLENAREYGKLLGYSESQRNRFRMVNMWFNQSDKGDFNFPHIHNGCLISGVFYIKTAPNNKIVFQDLTDTIAEPEEPTELAWRMRWIGCKPALLLLFKSDFIHGNPRQEEEGEKLVISFNIAMNYED
jgi:uncharacterized protein (TIGR02466 family)